MAGVLYTIDLNDKASSKVKNLKSNLVSADHATKQLKDDLSRVSLSTLSGKLSTLRNLRENVDVSSRAFKTLSKDIRHTERRLESLGATTKNTSSLFGIGFAALAYGGMRILAGGIKTALSAQIELEQATTRFAVLMNSTFRAERLVNWATKFANVTPLLRKDILGVSATLLQYGIAEKGIRAAVASIGDISGGDAERFNRLALAYGQVKAAGRLRGQEVLQMVNAGYNPMQKMAEMSGKSMATLRAEMAKGLITFDMVAAAFEKDTAAGGRFYGMMNKMSQTVGGKLSTLADAYNTKMATLGQRFEGVSKWGVEAVTTLVNTKGALEAVTVAVAALSVAMAIAALRATAMGSAMMSTAASLATNPYVLAIAAITALGVAIYNTTAKYDALAYSAERANKTIQEKGKELVGGSQEKDTRRGVEFAENQKKLITLERQIANTTEKPKLSQFAKEKKTIGERQEVIAKEFFLEYGYSKLKDGTKKLNNIIGTSWQETLAMMTEDYDTFLENLGKLQAFVREGVGTQETLKTLEDYFEKNATVAQMLAIRHGNLEDIYKVFKTPSELNFWGWGEEGDTRDNRKILGVKFPDIFQTKKKKDVEMNTKALEYFKAREESRASRRAFGQVDFEAFKEKPTTDTAPLDSQVDALKTGIVSGGSRTTNIYIQPQKALLNIEQWLGDTQDSVKLVGGKVAEELDRVLASFMPSTQM